MKIVQLAGGSKVTQDVYIGPEREVTVDTDNFDLRLHDGSTPGGHIIINRDNGDERWQGKSPELDGFTFAAAARGFLVRLGAGNFAIRKFLFATTQFTVVNPDGYGGNVTISLNDRIETDHTFAGNIVIEGTLTVQTGITANITGNVTGDVTGNLTGNVAGNVIGNLTGNTAGTHTGAVDVRGEVLLLDDDQIATSKIAGLQAFVEQYAVPSGVILLWSGLEAAIPAGWYLCNGLNGTPDLRDKFVIGAGSLSYAPGDSGGAATHAHNNTMDAGGEHSHVLTIATHALTEAEMPAHSHGNGVTDAGTALWSYGSKASPTTPDSIDNNGASGTNQGISETIGGGVAHGHPGSTADNGGSHSHTLNNASASSLPPYYALCYIMRVVV